MIQPNLRSIVGASLLLLSFIAIQASQITPIPSRYQEGKDSLRISEEIELKSNLAPQEQQMINEALRQLPFAINSPSRSHKVKATLCLTIDQSIQGSKERYFLSVGKRQIDLRANSAAGIYYGIQTLKQLCQTPRMGVISLPHCQIQDSPTFAYRGAMIDVSRHFFDANFIKKQIDAMASLKLNRLHLHLTDAAGWRLQIDAYPRLSQFAAWRPQQNWKEWWNNGRKYVDQSTPGAYGGFYTAQDVRDIVEYAQQHFMTIIPEIELPSHSEEVLAAYPELSCSGKPYVHGDFCVGNDSVFTFFEKVLDEVIRIFPSEYIHIGGDEASKESWKSCRKCQYRIQQEGLKDVNELQSYMVHRIERYLNSRGRKLFGWDEIIEGGLSPTATVISWRGENGAIEAVKQGNNAILAPGQYFYLDYYQDAPPTQPEAIGGYTPLRSVYEYRPERLKVTPEQYQLILGVQANLWTEYVPTPKQVEYMLYPRLIALAEIGWSQPNKRSWNDFYPRAIRMNQRLISSGYHCFDLMKEVGIRPESKDTIHHLAYGKRVIYNTPYSKVYPAGGDQTLTDGLRGNWTYSDQRWQGYCIPDSMDVTIDLGEQSPLKEIGADFMQIIGPWVYLPTDVRISVSEDGLSFRELTHLQLPVTINDGLTFHHFGWKGSTTARYIRYQAQGDAKIPGGWLFIDEIVVH